jgi:uncharacterized protein (DUF362 family)
MFFSRPAAFPWSCWSRASEPLPRSCHMKESRYRVRAVRCSHRSGDDVVYEALVRAAAPLERTWRKLRQARRIIVKFNQDRPWNRIVYFEGQCQQLVSDSVTRAVLRLLREETDAELVCADTSFDAVWYDEKPGTAVNIAPILREFGVRYIDGGNPPHRMCDMPGGGMLFRRYLMMSDPVEADAVVSVAKAKNHHFAGVTGCLKNLFGLVPHEPAGRPRTYFHHFVRLPYVLCDMGRALAPALNIVDALVGQAGMEWGDGKGMGRVVDALIAGDHVVATDACLTYLMGHDPQADWNTPPFLRDRNAVKVAADHGFGTADPEQVDFESEVDPQSPGVFFTHATDSPETNVSWRRTTCEQALCFRDGRRKFDRYSGNYILLQDGEVMWHGPRGILAESRRELSGSRPDHAMWLKYVDPDEVEDEHYDVYEKELQAVNRSARE